MTTLIERILQISLSMAAVIGVLLLLVPLWQKHYSARWRKIIWLVIAVRLVIPFSPELPQTAVQLGMDLQAAPTWQSAQMSASGDKVMLEPMVPSAAGEMGRVSGYQGNPLEEKDFPAITGKPMSQPISRGVLFFAVWLGGMICFLLWHGAQYGFFRRKVLAVAQPLEDSEELLQQAADGLQLRKMPVVAVSAAVQGPMLLSFTKPVVLLPQRFYGEQELLLILRHELMHHKLHDLWYKLVLLVANAVHWFNPLVWLMVRQAGRDAEQVCDEQVVRGQDLEYRKAYSMTILNAMASQRGVALSTYLSKQAQSGKKRFAAILYPQKYGKGVLTMAMVVLLAVAASGCLQVGVKEPVDVGLALYEKVAPWLPEGAIAQSENYTVEEIIGSYGMALDDKTYTYDGSEGKSETTVSYLLNENGQKTEEYIPPKRQLNVCATNTGKIYNVYYNCDETELVWPEVSLYGKEDECMDYVKQIAKAIIPDGKELQWQEYGIDESGITKRYLSEITADNYCYEITINTQYRYLNHLRKSYDNPEQLSQMQNWLSVQFHQQMENAFNLERVGQFYQQLGTQSRQGDLYTVKMDSYMISWRPQLTKQQWAQLDELIEHDPEGHQFVWKYLNLNYNSLYSFELSAPILEDGTLDLEQAAAYPVHSVDNRSYRAEMPLDWQQEEERWQMLWAAAHFAQGYTEKQQAMMDFFGTVNGLDFASYDYNTTVSYLLNECDKKSKDFTGMSGYDLQIELPNETQSNDYLTMTLEQIDSQWQVTDALLEK